MQREQRSSTVSVEYPDAYQPARGPRPAARGRTRGASAVPDIQAVDQALGTALQDLALQPVDEFELEAPPARRGVTRSTPPEEQKIAVDVGVAPGEAAAVLVEQDGVFAWSFAQAEGGERGVRTTRAVRNAPQRLQFEIPLAQGARQDRGLLSSAADLAGRVKVKVVKFAAGAAMGAAVKVFERKVRTRLVDMREPDPAKWLPLSGFSDLGLPADRPARILLFVHGTFSSTRNSFRGLAGTAPGKALLEAAAKHYDAIVGFDHRTLSATPEENATDLLALIEEHDWARPPVFDAVAYSRGGMVLRSLIEQLLPGSPAGATVRRSIFVGATNGGTLLAEPENWHDLLDLYTNMVVGASRALVLLPGTPPLSELVREGMEALSGLVKFLASEAIDGNAIPGLAAMTPDGEFVTRLNQGHPGRPGPDAVDYFAIVSDFEPGSPSAGGVAGELPPRFLSAVADRLIDRLMGVANDLVVDTPSMTSVEVQASPLVKGVLDFGQNGSVYHTVYFTQDRLAEAVRGWLDLGASPRAATRGGRSPLAQLPAELRAGADYAAAVDGPRTRAAAPEAPAAPKPKLRVEVLWGDITQADGDVFAVGHYPGILPQNAELALEGLVSAVDNPFRIVGQRDAKPEEYAKLVLTAMTRRNMIDGRLGEITYLPVANARMRPRKEGEPERPQRLVAVCGMGPAGSFNSASLRLLHRNLAWSLMAFPDPRQLCTVLIGAGEGALTPVPAVRGLLAGFGDALRVGGRSDVKVVQIVEITKHRAEHILEILTKLSESELEVDLDLRRDLRVGAGRRADRKHAVCLLVEAAAKLEPGADLAAVRAKIPRKELRIADMKKDIAKLWEESGGDVGKMARAALEERDDDSDDGQFATRMSFLSDGEVLRATVLTKGATVPERVIGTDRGLIAEAARRMTEPRADDSVRLGTMLHRLILPRDFRQFAANSPLELELDRHTAMVHWEMLGHDVESADCEAIGLRSEVSRKLRTGYSAAATLPRQQTGGLQALVVGDPGRPPDDELPGARREAQAVARLFQSLGVFEQVHVMIGAPGNASNGAPAERIDVLDLLMGGEIDVVHYAGHGTYALDDPHRTGWVFADGLLTAREVERIDKAPTLVFANACLSGRLSEVAAGGGEVRAPYGEAGLLPSLADEFFNRGVLNYIGTAWEVDDDGTIEFAKEFYARFFDGDPIGKAMLAARQRLHSRSHRYGSLWAAYQHYGDHSFRYSDL